ncbi:hypothetical protein B0T16DRAFT_362050 [Cercophora newfieldiana]|uniref:Uncharacterized protein n=1 Tax=Cercophora newfieldiana TaxID=92897 RepID=A0AA39YMA3_9PEZI|nr:hypothetical protein B0T16DRAFT_362050 [Cercophora newfieldiana]
MDAGQLDSAAMPPSRSWQHAQGWTTHQYQPIQRDLSEPIAPTPSNIDPTNADAQQRQQPSIPLEARHGSTHPILRWRPFYLRRFVLALFGLTLLLTLVAIEVLLVLSDKHTGIANGQSSQQYLWTFGPTAFLTLLIVIWGRIDYQSKLVAPWLRLAREPSHPSRTLQLDYLSDFLPWSVFRALRNKDFVVSITSAISALLKVLVIVSTGLITLSWTPVPYDSYPMTAQSVFKNSNASLASSGTLAYYMMGGHAERNLTYPDGIFDGYAFSSLQTDSRGPATTNVTVDAFRGYLDCQPTEVILRGSAPPIPQFQDQKMNLTISSADCNIDLLQLYGPDYTCENCTANFARYAPVWCNDGNRDVETDRRRIFVIFGSMSYTIDTSRNLSHYVPNMVRHPYIATLHRSAQLLCTPKFEMGKIEVVRNSGGILSVAPLLGTFGNRTLDSVDTWDIAKAHFNLTDSGENMLKGLDQYGIGVNVSNTAVDVDSYMELALPTQLSPNASLSSLYETPQLQRLANGYYQQSTAIIAKQALMEPAPIEVLGSATIFADRLLVRAWAAHWMAGMLAGCLVLVLIALFLVPTRNILPCNPSSIPGMASLIQQNHDLISALQFLGAASDKHQARALENTRFLSLVTADPDLMGHEKFTVRDTRSESYAGALRFPQIKSLQAHPAIVHPATRATLCVILAGLVVALELMLRKSIAEEGLGDAGSDAFIHYTWTTLPALVLGSIAMVISAMEFRVRCLAPYVALERNVKTQQMLMLDLLDLSMPRLLYREAKLANVGALAATLALLISSLFTIFSPSLFLTHSLPRIGSAELGINQSFARRPPPFGQSAFDFERKPQEVSSLIFASNYTFPRFTYQDLAFPQLVYSNESALQAIAALALNESAISIDAVVPAVRAKLRCRSYGGSQIRPNYTVETSSSGTVSRSISLLIQDEGCGYDSQKTYESQIRINPGTAYFGAAKESNVDFDISACSDLLYIWGKLNHEADPAVEHVAALGCNMTMEAVDVEVSFTGTALEIDRRKPPRPREETARASPIWDRNERPPVLLNIYKFLASLNSTRSMQMMPFFQLLTASPWAIPESDLGDLAADERIGEAIKFQHGIIVAQSLTFAQQPANISNATFADPKPSDNDAQLLFNAVVTHHEARRRVVQDALSTRVLQGLLGATLVFLILSWIFMKRTAVLASSPTTIASQAALIAGGNLLSLLPEDAQLRGPEEIAAALGPGTRFRMGWWAAADDGGECEGGSSRFGIFGVKAGGEDAKLDGAWTEYQSGDYAAIGDEDGGRHAGMSPHRINGSEESGTTPMLRTS